MNVMLCEFHHTFLKWGPGEGEGEGGNGKKNEETFGHRVGGMGSNQRLIGNHNFS